MMRRNLSDADVLVAAETIRLPSQCVAPQTRIGCGGMNSRRNVERLLSRGQF